MWNLLELYLMQKYKCNVHVTNTGAHKYRYNVHIRQVGPLSLPFISGIQILHKSRLALCLLLVLISVYRW